jgi:tetratricopeptide (TPR) repeat protein
MNLAPFVTAVVTALILMGFLVLVGSAISRSYAPAQSSENSPEFAERDPLWAHPAVFILVLVGAFATIAALPLLSIERITPYMGYVVPAVLVLATLSVLVATMRGRSLSTIWSAAESTSDSNQKAMLEQLVEKAVSSAGEAHTLVSALFEADQKDSAIGVVNRVIANDAVTGDANDFYNLATELLTQDQEIMALYVVNKAAKIHPSNVDILATRLICAGKIGDRQLGAESLEALEKFRPKWNWRTFIYAANYLRSVGEDSAALKFYDDMAVKFPDDERSYAQKMRIMDSQGKTEEAIEIGSNFAKRVPQAAQVNLILAEFYRRTWKYDLCLLACENALIATTDEQPAVNISAIYWEKAAALEATARQYWLQRSGKTGDELKELQHLVAGLIKSASTNYRTSVAMPKAVSAYRRQLPVALIRLNAVLEELGENPTVEKVDMRPNEKAISEDAPAESVVVNLPLKKELDRKRLAS